MRCKVISYKSTKVATKKQIILEIATIAYVTVESIFNKPEWREKFLTHNWEQPELWHYILNPKTHPKKIWRVDGRGRLNHVA